MIESLLLATARSSNGGGAEPGVTGKVVYAEPIVTNAPTPLASAFFGASIFKTDKNPVDTDNFVFVGESYGTNTNGVKNGAVHAYRPMPDGSLQYLQKINCPESVSTTTLFGNKGAVSGDGQMLAIPASTNGNVRVFTFKRSGDTWVKDATLNTAIASNVYLPSSMTMFANRDGTRFILVAASNGSNSGRIITFRLVSGSWQTSMSAGTDYGLPNSAGLGVVAAICEERNLLALYANISPPSPDAGKVVIFQLYADGRAPTVFQTLQPPKISTYSKSFGLGIAFSKSGKTLSITSINYGFGDSSTAKKVGLIDVFYPNTNGQYEAAYAITPNVIPGNGDGIAIYSTYKTAISDDGSIIIMGADGTSVGATSYNGSITTASLQGETVGIDYSSNWFIRGEPIVQSARRFGSDIVIDTDRRVTYVGASAQAYQALGSAGAIYSYPFTRQP